MGSNHPTSQWAIQDALCETIDLRDNLGMDVKPMPGLEHLLYAEV